jgi:hypothetical protein
MTGSNMAPFRYLAKILPDGQLPVPAEFPCRAGEEVEVTLRALDDGNRAAKAEVQAKYLLQRWAGVGRGSGSGVAEQHDDHLYGR